ncbi:MAG: heme ABC exporter ATP-binding protein CcmA [Ktedonobacterales bacterium]
MKVQPFSQPSLPELPGVREVSGQNLPANLEGGASVAETAISTQKSAVRISGVTKRYQLRPVLSGISYSLASGKTLALLGPNGAGKTTLLRILATLTRPSEGWATVASADVVRDAAEVRRLIGYVGHQPSVYPDLTGLENLLFFARIYGIADGPARAWLLLERVGLQGKARDRVRTYSRGQVQRLALVRGLLHEPELLLLDEPETGLDADAVSLLAGILQERREAGLSSIFTTHQLERGLLEGDEALVLVAGRAEYSGPAAGLDVAALAEIYARRSNRRGPLHRYTSRRSP